jgi:hypothetical protein
VLAQAGVCKAIEALGDQTGLAAAKASLEEYLKAAVMTITPRDQLGNKKIVSGWRGF